SGKMGGTSGQQLAGGKFDPHIGRVERTNRRTGSACRRRATGPRLYPRNKRRNQRCHKTGETVLARRTSFGTHQDCIGKLDCHERTFEVRFLSLTFGVLFLWRNKRLL